MDENATADDINHVDVADEDVDHDADEDVDHVDVANEDVDHVAVEDGENCGRDNIGR